MRVAISDEAGEVPLQVVRLDAMPPWRTADWSGLDPDVNGRHLQDLLAGDRTQGFDLASGVLLRAYLLRHSPVRHTIILSFHHLLLERMVDPDRAARAFEALSRGTATSITGPAASAALS